MIDWHAQWIEDWRKRTLRKLKEGTITPQSVRDRMKYPILKGIKQGMLSALMEFEQSSRKGTECT